VSQPHLFIAQSPLQVLFSNLSRKARGISFDDSVLLVIEASHGLSNQQMADQVAHDGWTNVRVANTYPPVIPSDAGREGAKQLKVDALQAFIRQVSDFLAPYDTRFSSVTVGDLRESLVLLIIRDILKIDSVWAVDDGSVTPQVALSRWNSDAFEDHFDKANFSRKHFYPVAQGAGLATPINPPEHVLFHSIYQFPVPITDYWQKLDPRTLDVEFEALDVLDEVWIVGNNHVDGGLTTRESYIALIENIVNHFDGRTIRYLPHRKESQQHIDHLAEKLGMQVEVPSLPLEMRIIRSGARPSVIAGSASTVFDFLHWYSSGKQERMLVTLPDSYFTGKRSTHLQMIQKYHELSAGEH
jgi:hypothetical protein